MRTTARACCVCRGRRSSSVDTGWDVLVQLLLHAGGNFACRLGSWGVCCLAVFHVLSFLHLTCNPDRVPVCGGLVSGVKSWWADPWQ